MKRVTIFLTVAIMIMALGCERATKKTDSTVKNDSLVSAETFEILDVQTFREKLASFTYIKSAEELMYLYYNYDLEAEGNQKLSINTIDFGDDIYEVTLIHEGLPDDSVYALKIVMTAKRTGSTWMINEIKRNWKCQKGRGHQNWGTELCL